MIFSKLWIATPAWQFRAAKGGRKRYEEITNRRRDILVFETEPLDTDWFVSIFTFSDDDGPIPLGNPWGRGKVPLPYSPSGYSSLDLPPN